jgi:lipopolysaccharide transport system ATP-binding protein
MSAATSGPAIVATDLGVRFTIRRIRTDNVHSGIVRFLKGRAPAEEFWALRHVSFDVPVGTSFGIIGSNGSGKSTLLRALSRIMAPDEGELEIRGRTSSLISLGAGFEPQLSGRENIYFNGQLLGMSRAQITDRIDDIIGFAELRDDFINAPVKTYSSGMRARLGFSVAIHVDPDILIVDEVLTVGDAKFRNKCRLKFEELFERGTTVVMVQHNLDMIADLCSRVMWLERGELMEVGEPEPVIRAYVEHQGLEWEPRPDPIARPAGNADARR